MAAEKQQEKRCTGPCKRMLPLECFHRNKTKKTGRESRCRTCANARVAVYDAENHEAKLERLRRYHAENRERELERLRQRHKEHGYPDKRPFLYSDQHREEDIWQKSDGRCCFCAAPQERRARGPWTDDDCWQIHHRVPRKRFGSDVVANCWVCCSQCHRAAHRQIHDVLPLAITAEPTRRLPISASPEVEPAPLAADLHTAADLVDVPWPEAA